MSSPSRKSPPGPDPTTPSDASELTEFVTRIKTKKGYAQKLAEQLVATPAESLPDLIIYYKLLKAAGCA